VRLLFLVVFVAVAAYAAPFKVPTIFDRNKIFEERITDTLVLREHVHTVIQDATDHVLCATFLTSRSGQDFSFLKKYLGRYRWRTHNVASLTMALYALNEMDHLLLDVGLKNDVLKAPARVHPEKWHRRDWGHLTWSLYDTAHEESFFPSAAELSRLGILQILMEAQTRRLGGALKHQLMNLLYDVSSLPPEEEMTETEHKFFALAQLTALAVDLIGSGTSARP